MQFVCAPSKTSWFLGTHYVVARGGAASGGGVSSKLSEELSQLEALKSM